MPSWQLMSWCSPCCGLLLQKGKSEEEEEEQNSELGLRGRSVGYWELEMGLQNTVYSSDQCQALCWLFYLY